MQEPLGSTGIDQYAPGEAPSPSPSITRRRTPAVLAAGGPLCGVWRFVIQFGGRNGPGAEPGLRSVVIGGLAPRPRHLSVWKPGRVCGPVLLGWHPALQIVRAPSEADRNQLPARTIRCRRRHQPAEPDASGIE